MRRHRPKARGSGTGTGTGTGTGGQVHNDINGGTYHGPVVMAGEARVVLFSLFQRIPRPVAWLLALLLVAGAVGGAKLLTADRAPGSAGSDAPGRTGGPGPSRTAAGDWSGGYHWVLPADHGIDLDDPVPDHGDTTAWTADTLSGWYGKGGDGHEQVGFKDGSAAFLAAGQPATHAACLAARPVFSPVGGFAPQGFDPGTRICVFTSRADALLSVSANTAVPGQQHTGELTFEVLYGPRSG
ncbi:hypothetical protein [Kitasatospora sp. NPDC088346]|uniref:hypothetical protein n=1 Tax=Kitasatospora sp. NPDC088346 TaxID=3364073 RepID=UPI0037F863DB